MIDLNAVNVGATVFSALFAGASYWSSYMSKKAKDEAKAKLDAAILEAESARRSAEAAEEANSIAEEHIRILKAQMEKASENNQVAIHWDYEDKNPEERGYITLKNVGTGTAHNFNAVVGLYQDLEKVEKDVLGPGDCIKVYIQALHDELEEHEKAKREAEESAKRSPFLTSTYVPLMIHKNAFTIDATWISPAGNPGRWSKEK